MPKHALIIEDDEPTRFMLQELFNACFPDCELTVLNDSCNYQKHLADIERPDLVIIDIYLLTCPPGNIVMQWMRGQGSLQDTKYIAFTADSLLEGEQLLSEGFDAVIIKPVKNTELFISQILRVMRGETFIYNG